MSLHPFCNLQTVIRAGDLGCRKRGPRGNHCVFSYLPARQVVLWPFLAQWAQLRGPACPLHWVLCTELPLGRQGDLWLCLVLGGRIREMKASFHWNSVGWQGAGVDYPHSCLEPHTGSSGAANKAGSAVFLSSASQQGQSQGVGV